MATDRLAVISKKSRKEEGSPWEVEGRNTGGSGGGPALVKK